LQRKDRGSTPGCFPAAYMLDDTVLAAALRTYLLETAPVLLLELDAGVRVVDANRHAQEMLGKDVIGCALLERLVGMPSAATLASVMARRGEVHRLALSTAFGVLETLHFRFFPLAGGTLACGGFDFQEQQMLGGELTALRAEKLNRESSQTNTNNGARHEYNDQQARERRQHNELLHHQSLASLNLMEDAMEARELVEQANAELRASEARGRAIFKGAPEAAFIVYPGGRCVDLNAITLPRYGYSREEFLGMKPGDLVAPELKAEFLLQLERGRAGIVRFESRHRRKDKSEFPVDMSLSPLVLDGVECLLCTARDSSERKAAEEALRRSELQYGSLLEGAPDPIVVIDKACRIVLVNAEAERLFGYPRAELLGQPIELLIPFHLPFPWEEPLATDEVERLTTTTEGQARHKNGGEIPLEVRLSGATGWAADSQWQIMLAMRDLSDIKRAEAKFQKLLEAAPDAVVVANETGEMVLVNSRAEKMFGQTRGALLGQNIEGLFPERFRDDLAEQRAMDLADLQTQSLVAAAELFGWRRDGSEFPIEVSHSPLKTQDGLLVFTAIRDVTERKNAERRSRQLELVATEAQAANKAKTMFLSTLSHEIRTPMNAILGYSQLLLRDNSLGPEAQANLKIINRSGEHLLHMIDDILDLAKIEAGHAQLSPRTFALHALLKDLEAMFRLRAMAKGLQLEALIDGERLHYLIADEGKIRQVLINLLGNAVKFTERGQIGLKANVDSRADGQLWLSVRVDDSGVGITAEEQNELFQPFVQGKASEQTGNRGTGLGLAISQKVARLMGGAVTVSSVPGVGSSFLFETPVLRAAERDFKKHSGFGPRVIGLLRAEGAAAPRILIADDRPDNREWLNKLLSTLGFAVRTANDGEAAVRLAEEWHPQLILMDMHMPRVNGLEATQRIKSGPRGRDIVVIAVTADALDDYRQVIVRNEVNDFIAKPCTEEQLLEKIRKHLGLVYFYEEETSRSQEETAYSAMTGALNPPNLRELPEELIRRLRSATLSGDKVLLNELILVTEERGETELARVLQELADEYQYEKLVQLLEDA
jgi:PAS domain S-box-containing protein